MTSNLLDLYSINISDSNKAVLSFLVKNEEELELFLVEFWTGEWEDQFEALQKFRLYKQKELTMTVEAFASKASVSPKEAFETLCQYPIPEHDFKMLVKLMDRKELTWGHMYQKHKQRPAYMPLGLVL